MMTVAPVNAVPIQEPISSSLAVATGNDKGGHDYIMIEDIFQDMDDDGGGEDGEEATMTEPMIVLSSKGLVNQLDEDEIPFGLVNHLDEASSS
jgi:hypothetical protein